VEGDDSAEVDPYASHTPRKGDDEEKSDKGEPADTPHVSWTYSSYKDALEKEDILNNTNEDTFSCLSVDCK